MAGVAGGPAGARGVIEGTAGGAECCESDGSIGCCRSVGGVGSGESGGSLGVARVAAVSEVAVVGAAVARVSAVM